MECPFCDWEGEPKDYLEHHNEDCPGKRGEARWERFAPSQLRLEAGPVHPEHIKLEAPPVMIEDAMKSGLMEAIGITLLKRVEHWANKIDEEKKLFRAGAVTKDVALENIHAFVWSMGENVGVAESLGVPQHIIKRMEILYSSTQQLAYRL